MLNHSYKIYLNIPKPISSNPQNKCGYGLVTVFSPFLEMKL